MRNLESAYDRPGHAPRSQYRDQASPEAVYDLVSDLPCMGEWSPEDIGGEWQGGGSGKVGDRYIGHNQTSERSWSVPVLVTVGEVFPFTYQSQPYHGRIIERLESRANGLVELHVQGALGKEHAPEGEPR